MSGLTPEKLEEIFRSPEADYMDSWVDLDPESIHFARTIGLDGRWKTEPLIAAIEAAIAPKAPTDAELVDQWWKSCGDEWAVPEAVMIRFGLDVLARWGLS